MRGVGRKESGAGAEAKRGKGTCRRGRLQGAGCWRLGKWPAVGQSPDIGRALRNLQRLCIHLIWRSVAWRSRAGGPRGPRANGALAHPARLTRAVGGAPRCPWGAGEQACRPPEQGHRPASAAQQHKRRPCRASVGSGWVEGGSTHQFLEFREAGHGALPEHPG